MFMLRGTGSTPGVAHSMLHGHCCNEIYLAYSRATALFVVQSSIEMVCVLSFCSACYIPAGRASDLWSGVS